MEERRDGSGDRVSQGSLCWACPLGWSTELVNVNGNAVLHCRGTYRGPLSPGLWKSDGTAAGTTLLGRQHRRKTTRAWVLANVNGNAVLLRRFDREKGHPVD